MWVEGVALPKVADFAGEADAADASELRDYAVIKWIALLACLAHKARMQVHDDLATMFCKRVAVPVPQPTSSTSGPGLPATIRATNASGVAGSGFVVALRVRAERLGHPPGLMRLHWGRFRLLSR